MRRPSGRGSCAIAPPATSVIMVPLGTPPPAGGTGMVPARGSAPVVMVSWRVLATTATAPGGLVAAVMGAVLLRTGGVGDGLEMEIESNGASTVEYILGIHIIESNGHP